MAGRTSRNGATRASSRQPGAVAGGRRRRHGGVLALRSIEEPVHFLAIVAARNEVVVVKAKGRTLGREEKQ